MPDLSIRHHVDSVSEYARSLFGHHHLSKSTNLYTQVETFGLPNSSSHYDLINLILSTLFPTQDFTLIPDGDDTSLHAVGDHLCLHLDFQKKSVIISAQSTTLLPLSPLKQLLPPAPIRVKWVYSPKGDYTYIPIDLTNLPEDNFYPNLPTPTLSQFYEEFINSRANILLLIGPPGTGKTSFIRGLLAHTRSNALISYDSGILEQDSIFAEFMSSHSRESVMVLEDADTFLTSRSKSPNSVMHKFLNVGDGLISTAEKKIIFTTNLPSVRDVDSALLRPGRCYSVLEFGKLTPEQAKAIRPDQPLPTSPTTLAELLNNGGGPSPSSRVGF